MGLALEPLAMIVSSSVSPPKRRILLVDDDLSGRDALAGALRERYEVFVASDGRQGVEMAARVRPDLVVTDVSMPVLDGIAMVRELREQQGLRVPVIFLTAFDRPQLVIAAIGAGARHYLIKPVEISELEQRIARAFGLPSEAPQRP